MNEIKVYKTRQRELILNCLSDAGDRHLTVKDVMYELSKRDINVGQTTIYRHLDRLVSEGVVRRFYSNDSGSTCYQYVGGRNCTNHYHLKCTQCGELVHFECDELDKLYCHIGNEHGFEIDVARTVFYGKCARCGGKIG